MLTVVLISQQCCTAVPCYPLYCLYQLQQSWCADLQFPCKDSMSALTCAKADVFCCAWAMAAVICCTRLAMTVSGTVSVEGSAGGVTARGASAVPADTSQCFPA